MFANPRTYLAAHAGAPYSDRKLANKKVGFRPLCAFAISSIDPPAWRMQQIPALTRGWGLGVKDWGFNNHGIRAEGFLPGGEPRPFPP
jgi:hypothetical protein